MSAEFPWTYFVSYSHGRGFGSVTLGRRVPLDPGDAGTELRQAVVKVAPQFALNEIVILNFQLMAWPGSCPSCGRSAT